MQKAAITLKSAKASVSDPKLSGQSHDEIRELFGKIIESPITNDN
jgi:hypothetical protein